MTVKVGPDGQLGHPSDIYIYIGSGYSITKLVLKLCFGRWWHPNKQFLGVDRGHLQASVITHGSLVFGNPLLHFLMKGDPVYQLVTFSEDGRSLCAEWEHLLKAGDPYVPNGNIYWRREVHACQVVTFSNVWRYIWANWEHFLMTGNPPVLVGNILLMTGGPMCQMVTFAHVGTGPTPCPNW